MNTYLQKEKEQAFAIIQLEEKALKLLETFPSVKNKLRKLKNLPRKHNGQLIDAMEESVADLELKVQSIEEKRTIKRIKHLQTKANELRWQLAMSADQIAQLEARRMCSSQLPQEDLIHEGLIGLLEAAKRYDPEQDIRFTTYARWWVRAQMTRCIENTGRIVRVPGGAIEQLRNLQRLIEEFKSNNEEFTHEDLAERLNISRKRVALLLSVQGTVSLDSKDDDGHSISDILPSDTVALEKDMINQEALSLIQEKFTDYLDQREQFILINHFGLDERPKQTMREIGEQISLSKERVRQIEVGALQKLKEIFI